MSWTREQADAHQRRHNFPGLIAPASALPVHPAAVRRETREENALQAEFESWLRQHDYLYRREPMHRATFAPPGHPDFTVTLAGGRVAYFEYKTPTGRLSPEQIIWHERAQERGVPVFVVRSLAFAVDCLRQVEKRNPAHPISTTP